MKNYKGLIFTLLIGSAGCLFAALNDPPASSQGKIQVTDTVMSGYPDVLQFSTGSFTNSNGIFTHVIVAASNSAPRTNVTPNIKGQIIFNTTASELCFSTGVVASSWVKVSTPNAACAN